MSKQTKNEWVELSWFHHVYVNPDGEIIAEITNGSPLGVFHYKGKKWINLDAAKKAVECDHP